MSESSFELPRLLERMHRRFLDVLRAELNRLSVDDLNSVQAFLLLDIGDEETSVQELVNRGYYVHSNALYNIKKLVEAGYFEQSRSPNDRRAVRVKLTKKAREICDKIRGQMKALDNAINRSDESPAEMDVAYRALRRLERAWDEYLRYGKL